MDTKLYPLRTLSRSTSWQEGTTASVKGILKDPIVSKLLLRSNVTRAQFETLLVNQLGHDMANKRLTRNEMEQLMRNSKGICREAFNINVRQTTMQVA